MCRYHQHALHGTALMYNSVILYVAEVHDRVPAVSQLLQAIKKAQPACAAAAMARLCAHLISGFGSVQLRASAQLERHAL